MSLQVKAISKSYDSTQALKEVTFELNSGEIAALLGPSGCGKTTLLKLIAGLEQPDSGTISWAGEDLAGRAVHKRNFSMMFQEYALFPHKNVFSNIAFGLEMRGEEQEVIRSKVQDLLELVGLTGFGARAVDSLSGGEQQRVALARSLAPNPALLLLDEPLGALDRRLRQQLLEDLRAILARRSQTAIYVSHDQEEAFALADKVAIFNSGQLEQLGTPQQIYLHPATPFVAAFLGFENFITGTISKGILHTALGNFDYPDTPSGPVKVLLRPDSVSINPQEGSVMGTLLSASFRGEHTRIRLLVEKQAMSFELNSQIDLPAIGEKFQLGFEPGRALQIFK